MKSRLLKRLRRKGRNQIDIISVTRTNGTVTGMSIGYNDKRYGDLFSFGDTEADVKRKAEQLYINDYLKLKNRH